MKNFKKDKIFKILSILFILGVVFGIVFTFLISEMDKSYIENELINYFDLVNSNSFNYIKGLINSIESNFLFLFLIWIFGLIYILSFITPFLVFYKGFTISFLVTNTIMVFKLKGVVFSTFMILPHEILNIILIIIMSFYSLRFAKKISKIIKSEENSNLKIVLKNYIIIFLVIFSISILSSILETFVSSNILKFVI